MTTTEERVPVVHARRRRVEAQLALLGVVDAIAEHFDDLTEVDTAYPGCQWRYVEPFALKDSGPATRRDAALGWLARHTKVVTKIVKAIDPDVTVEKVGDDFEFGVQAMIRVGEEFVIVRAVVPSALTCEMVDTGEVRVVPAQPEREEPVLERRCPPSIFAGIQDEVVPDVEQVHEALGEGVPA